MQGIKVLKGFRREAEATLSDEVSIPNAEYLLVMSSPFRYDSELADCGAGMRQQRHCDSRDPSGPNLIHPSAPRQLPGSCSLTRS